MRTTLRIDDDLFHEIRERAHRENIPITDLVNRLLRVGLEPARSGGAKTNRPYREQVFSMGQPRVLLHKALAVAAALEDEEVLEELTRRK
jgi:hypothetical protein